MLLSKFLKFELIKTDQQNWILLTDPKLSNNDVLLKLDFNFAERTFFNINVYKSTWDSPICLLFTSTSLSPDLGPRMFIFIQWCQFSSSPGKSKNYGNICALS